MCFNSRWEFNCLHPLLSIRCGSLDHSHGSWITLVASSITLVDHGSAFFQISLACLVSFRFTSSEISLIALHKDERYNVVNTSISSVNQYEKGAHITQADSPNSSIWSLMRLLQVCHLVSTRWAQYMMGNRWNGSIGHKSGLQYKCYFLWRNENMLGNYPLHTQCFAGSVLRV